MGGGGREEGEENLQLQQQGQPRRLCLAWLRRAYVRGLVSELPGSEAVFSERAGRAPGWSLARVLAGEGQDVPKGSCTVT